MICYCDFFNKKIYYNSIIDQIRMQANKLIILKPGQQHREQEYKQSIKLMENISNHFNECYLMLGAWQKNNIGEVCQYVQEWRLPSSLFLEYNKCPTILKEISNIYFPFLQKLFLRTNHIQSIEIVCQLNMPSLQKVWFGNNQICTIKSLRRAYFPRLKCLTLCCNKLNELQLLEEFYAPLLTDIDLQRSERDDQNRYVSLKTLIRLQSSCGKINIWALNPYRIKQAALKNCLRRKHQIHNIYFPN